MGIEEHPKLICSFAFLMICGIVVAFCGAYEVFNQHPDYRQNLTPKAAKMQDLKPGNDTKLQNSKEKLNTTEENTQNSKENSKEMELLPLALDAPHSTDDTELKDNSDSKTHNQHNLEGTKLTAFQRNKKTKIFFGISVLLNYF